MDKRIKSKQTEVGSAALAKHESTRKLKHLLKDANPEVKVMDYLKSLSPSGVELEILCLTQFEFGQEVDSANHYVSSSFFQSLM